ncbi:LacI family DNA-binding transcriptional regulator [Wenyingzhuangia sp. 2_MG-2023]|uniref:LacI family DNA-binding transcriptional regulator n=1 Tax=Wenyingzhuangia sp. 2_MG-2023 TaxID=3062639 RepID=UPI0026E440CC|nr:LacI family DNA-binding transcriptional regulator [Wenyingzhuangia sp. 2_MG-2023]MDO6738701.1 LacI family DNA-binding transcriptional regulator [Wenyingzhuangia sp. 2_MG-2023]MDO6802368.1 LacI family DNA-binding transcriptional regulator [Wenyingzhuangia sp. 1_MG-2023]
MKKTRITLKDLALELKLAPSTISRALDNHPAISNATKKRVQQKADEIGFVPNSIASSFRKKKTQSIGIIVPRIDVHFHSLVISGIEEYSYDSGYNVTIFQSNNSLKREEEIARILQNKMVEGVIACLAIETENYDHFKKFKKLGVPVVFYDRVPSNFDANKIVINDFESAFTATEHLINMGCKRIGHIAGNQSTTIFKYRLAGYKAALEKHQLNMDPRLISYTNDLSYDEGVESAEAFLALPELPDGIFCANDYTAVSAIQVFRRANIKIPEDIAIVGFSNYPISKVIEPHITTVNDQAFQMGCTAAKLLIRLIEDDDDDSINSETISLKTELIVRESSMKNKDIIN